jgi:hypothetical protein
VRSTAKLIYTLLFTACAALAQGPPPPGFGGPGGPGFAGPGGPGGHAGPPVTGAPFSATRTETHQETLADGNLIQQTRTEKVYRDVDGRMRTESTMTTPSGASKTTITIVDPVAGFVAHLNPADSSAFKMTLHTPPAGAPKAPPESSADANRPQRVKTDLGSKTVGGLEATGTSVKMTIPAGAMGNAQAIVETREIWVSTALKIPVEVTSNDPRHGNSSMVMSNIAPGAQDPTLFQIPSSYTVKDAPAHHGPGGPGPGGPPPADGGSI